MRSQKTSPAVKSFSDERTGVLLVNLGTPEGTGYFAVRRYLSEFLSDRRVIEAPPFLWQPFLQAVILSTRPLRSGRAYARIWDQKDNASPLRVFTRRLAENVSDRWGGRRPVAYGMRYGTPSIAQALEQLISEGCDRVIMLPLYPQYSAATTATANDQVFRALMKLRRQPSIVTVPSYAAHPLYIKALEETTRAHLATLAVKPQQLVVSFHGLPQLCVAKGDPYASDCERTVDALRRALGLTPAQMPLTYQSRFGPMAWLQPYTAPYIQSLPTQGITRIAVMMPGFMCDCLETLDEIGNELREAFLHAGGEEMTLVPCLNASPSAVELVSALIEDSWPAQWPKD